MITLVEGFFSPSRLYFFHTQFNLIVVIHMAIFPERVIAEEVFI